MSRQNRCVTLPNITGIVPKFLILPRSIHIDLTKTNRNDDLTLRRLRQQIHHTLHRREPRPSHSFHTTHPQRPQTKIQTKHAYFAHDDTKTSLERSSRCPNRLSSDSIPRLIRVASERVSWIRVEDAGSIAVRRVVARMPRGVERSVSRG